jgi:hypothetical protein
MDIRLVLWRHSILAGVVVSANVLVGDYYILASNQGNNAFGGSMFQIPVSNFFVALARLRVKEVVGTPVICPDYSYSLRFEGLRVQK